jgi:ribonuclease HI
LSTWTVKCDGGCPANPGPGAFAFVIEKEDGSKITRSGFMPVATNNTAEYRAVNAAAVFLQGTEQLPDLIEIWSDSEVIVNQLKGLYQVRSETLHPFFLEAKRAVDVLRERAKVTITHFKREHNAEADELCNEVLRRRGIEIVSKKKAKV